MNAMPVALQRHESRWVISLEGEISVTSAAELKTLLLEWLAAGKDLELDLERAEELDITILQLLWAAAREATRTGVTMAGHASAAAIQAIGEAGFAGMPGFSLAD
jgi:anti-anti-sigma regulatory factor